MVQGYCKKLRNFIMKMRVILPDYVVDEANGKHYDSDWNDLDTTRFPLPLSLCILVGITFKQTESNCQHIDLSNYYLVQTSGMVQEG